MNYDNNRKVECFMGNLINEIIKYSYLLDAYNIFYKL